MKKLLTIGCLFLGTIFFNNNAIAQSAGVGLAYGTEIEAIGIQANGVYGFTEEIRGAVDFTFYFPEQPAGGGEISFWALNANAHYLFMSEGTTNVYGLGGLNYSSQEASYSSQFGSYSSSVSEVGLNLGGGAEFGIDFGSIFVEAKYIISDFDQLVLDAGVRFGL